MVAELDPDKLGIFLDACTSGNIADYSSVDCSEPAAAAADGAIALAEWQWPSAFSTAPSRLQPHPQTQAQMQVACMSMQQQLLVNDEPNSNHHSNT